MSELPELTVVEIDKGKPVIKKATPGEWTREELEESVRRCNCHDELIEACEDYIRHCELHNNSEHPKANMFCTECPRYRKKIETALDKAKDEK